MSLFSRLCLGIVVVASCKSMLRPLVPLYAVALGASPAIVGILVSLMFVLPLFSALWLGRKLDRAGALPYLRGGVVILLASIVLLVAIPDIWALGAAQLLFGLAQLMIVLSAQTLVSHLSPGRSSTQNFAWYSSAQSTGQLIGPIAGGVAVDFLGFQVTFFLSAIVALLALIGFSFMPKIPVVKAPSPEKLDRGSGGARQLLYNPAVQLGIAVSASVLTALTFFSSFFPIYLESLSYPATLIGVLFSARAFASLASRLFMQQIVRLHGNRSLTLVSMTAILAVSVALVGYSEHLVLLMSLSLLIGVSSGISQPLSMSIVSDHVRSDRRGLAMGLRLTGNRIAQLLSPVLLGLVAESFGLRITFVLAGAGLVIGAGYTLISRKTFEAMDVKYAKPPS